MSTAFNPMELRIKFEGKNKMLLRVEQPGCADGFSVSVNRDGTCSIVFINDGRVATAAEILDLGVARAEQLGITL